VESQRTTAVIGASAAGLLTARLLAEKGVPVRVYERAQALDPATRSLIVTSRLRDIMGDRSDRAVVNEISRFELFTDGRSAAIELRRPDLIVERSILIPELARQAQEAGAEIFFGHRFVGLRPAENGVVLSIQSDSDRSQEVLARNVVGGDGAFSRVARVAGWPQQGTVPLMQAIVELPEDVPATTSRVWFKPEETRYFYWLIPDSATTGALGLIGEDGKESPRRLLDAFLGERGMKTLEYQGARIPLYTAWTPVARRLGGGSIFLVGDAAGQVKVSTVGGLVTCFRGAVGVANAITGRGASRELRRLRRELDLHLLIRKTLHHFGQDDYSRMLDLLEGAAGQSVGHHDRDQAARVLLKVFLARPRLAGMMLRSYLRRDPFPLYRENAPAAVMVGD
jgi:digeranylgeranylglycerophospholipid reductase